MYRILLTLVALSGLSIITPAQNAGMRFGHEAADTIAIGQMLDKAAGRQFANPEVRVAFFARMFEGIPYAAHTLEGEPETLTIRIDSLDCTTFTDTALALAYTVGEGRYSWRDYAYNLRRMRYRGGETNGYPSRLHYIADWIADNQHRGNLRDVTRDFPRVNELTRTIDFMSAHRDRYPALADDSNYQRMRSIEGGYRNHRIPFVKSLDLGLKATKAAFHDGDVVALVSTLKDLDVTHMGIVVKDTADGEPYLLHASYSHGKVERTAVPLAEFMKKNRQWLGVRVLRLVE